MNQLSKPLCIDGQKTWQVTWDSYYVRKSAPAK